MYNYLELKKSNIVQKSMCGYNVYISIAIRLIYISSFESFAFWVNYFIQDTYLFP